MSDVAVMERNKINQNLNASLMQCSSLLISSYKQNRYTETYYILKKDIE